MASHLDATRNVVILDPAADAAGRASRAVSLKSVQGICKLHVVINQGNAATVAVTPQQCTNVAGAGAKAIPASPIRLRADQATSSVPAEVGAAVSYTTDAALASKLVTFLIDPATLDQAGGFDCIRLTTGASNAANITGAWIEYVPRYQGGGEINLRAD